MHAFEEGGKCIMRKEHDFLGELEIPDNAYYGVQTMRAMENFQITGYTADPLFIKALGMVKKAAALANMKIGLLDEKSAMLWCRPAMISSAAS